MGEDVFGGLGLGVGASLADEPDEDEDGRWPVTVTFPKYGTWTIPQAFAFWLDDQGLIDEFDDLICLRREHKTDGDPMGEFMRDRSGVPASVREAVAGYGDLLDAQFGRPADDVDAEP